MLSDFESAKVLGHRKNLERYRWLLGTELTEHERTYIQKRVMEEKAELERLEELFVQDIPAEEAEIVAANARNPSLDDPSARA